MVYFTLLLPIGCIKFSKISAFVKDKTKFIPCALKVLYPINNYWEISVM